MKVFKGGGVGFFSKNLKKLKKIFGQGRMEG